MKKFIIILIILMSIFLLDTKVKAEEFSAGEWIPNIYISKVNNGITHYGQAQIIRNSYTNEYVYCVEPFVLFHNGSYIPITNKDEITNYINADVWDKINLITYYGYGYHNHNDIKWYAVTQYLIWKEIHPNNFIYFTNGLNGNYIEPFKNEINEITNLVNNHYVLPSFSEQEITININESITVTDTLNVLETFETNNPNVSIQGNNLIIKGSDIEEETITFSKKKYGTDSTPILFNSQNNQNLMLARTFYPLSFNLKIKRTSGKIKILKYDYDSNKPVNNSEAKLEGSIFEVYNSDNKLVDKITINSNKEAITKALPLGKYIIKEIKAGTGYKLNQELYEVELNENNIVKEIIIKNKVINGKLEIIKYFGNEDTNEYTLEENISFEIYDHNNKLVKTITTDEKGYASTILAYGTYKVKQKNSHYNYDKVDDFIVVVDEKSPAKLSYTLKDNIKTTTLKIKKVDSENNIIDTSPAYFKIKDLNTNKYFDNTFKTNELGILEITNLPYGKYEIYEVQAPTGYILLKDPIYIEINEDSDFVNNCIEINIVNDILVEVPNAGIPKKSYNPYILILTIGLIIYVKKQDIKNNNLITTSK